LPVLTARHIHLWTTIYINKYRKGGRAIGKKQQLIICYHNPNTDEETLKYITKIFIEASRVAFENIVQETAIKENPT